MPSVGRLTQPACRLGRLRQRPQFEAVLASPPCAKTAHFALHMADPQQLPHGAVLFPGSGPWLGVMLPKRWARHAVTRNALRRQIYAAAQELVATLPQRALVVRLRSTFSRKVFLSACSDQLKRAARAELLELLGPRLPRPTPPESPA